MVGNIPKLVKIYKAEILEYDNGKTVIIYECDKERNVECKGRKNCRDCYLTTEKKFAKNFYNN